MTKSHDLRILLNYQVRKTINIINLNKNNPQGKINLNEQTFAFFGKHRSGLKYAVNCLKPLHNSKGVLFDAMIERTFVWHPTGSKYYNKPWIGIIHVPPNVPHWFDQRTTNDAILKSTNWNQSYKYCLGLFTLSDYHKKYLQTKINIPINKIILPTEEPLLKWSLSQFLSNKDKKIIQIGWWLRKLYTIFLLPAKKYKKVLLRLDYIDIDKIINAEKKYWLNLLHLSNTPFNSSFSTKSKYIEDTLIMPFLNNKDYDILLSQNLVILNLWDSSLNNAIIECIMRGTPILINKIEPVIEYLGNDYPLYFDSLDEAANKAEDIDLIYSAHQYLTSLEIKEKLTKNYFLNSFINSEIYQNL
jgi:hypothetical protein